MKTISWGLLTLFAFAAGATGTQPAPAPAAPPAVRVPPPKPHATPPVSLAPAPAGAAAQPLPSAAAVGDWQRVAVAVHADRVLHHLAEKGYHGINFVALWNDTGDSPGTVNAFSQMGLDLVRFPGGCPAEWYDWQEPLATGWSTLAPENAWGLAKAGRGRVIFQTNVATDSEGRNKETGAPYKFDSSGAHAAAWVRASRQQGIDVAFWEIGNEPEIDAPKAIKDRNSQAAVYDWYNAKYREHVEAMKAVDPKARFMGPAACNTWFWWAQGNLARFLKAHGNKSGTGLADAVSLHWYPEGGAGSWAQKRGAAQEWAGCMAFIRKTIAEHDTRPLPLYVTEWNWGAGDKNDGAQSLANALGTADTIGMFLRTGVAGHSFFCLQKVKRGWGVLAMQKQECRPPDEAAPTYYALALAARLAGDALETASSADERNVLSGYATRRQDGTLTVMLINKGAEPLLAEVAIEGARAAGASAKLFTLEGSGDPKGGPEDKDVVYNGVARPTPWKNVLPPPRALSLTATGPLAVPLSPFSLAVVELKVQ